MSPWSRRQARAVWAVVGAIALTGFALWGGDGMWRVTVESENLRESPNGKKIGTLLEGAALDTLEVDGRWVRVRVEGWVWGPSLDGFEAPAEDFEKRQSFWRYLLTAAFLLLVAETLLANWLSRHALKQEAAVSQ